MQPYKLLQQTNSLPRNPPPTVTVEIRRETYRELLKAKEFFGVVRHGVSLSDTVDELLVSYAIAREEASGAKAHA